MSVIVEVDHIRLSGRCHAEDAETLLLALQDNPGLRVSIDGVQKLHLAVLQVLLAARPRVTGAPEPVFLVQHVAHLFE